MYHINGYVYGNMPELDGICEGEEIALYVFSLANGIHDMQIYGQTMVHRNHRYVEFSLVDFFFFVCLFCRFTSQVNNYGHGGTVSSPNHTFSWAGLNKRLTSNSCTYFRL